MSAWSIMGHGRAGARCFDDPKAASRNALHQLLAIAVHLVLAIAVHLAERRVPALLPPLLRAAGFAPEPVRPLTVVDTSLRPDGFARMLLRAVEDFARARPGADGREARAWAEEQARLAREGRFFLSVTHYITAARKL